MAKTGTPRAKGKRKETKASGPKSIKRPASPAPTVTEAPKTGRPTMYTDEIGREICEMLAEGKTLSSVCAANEHFPCAKTIRRWALDPEHRFSPMYTRARELGYQAMGDDILDAADDGRNDWMETFDKDGESTGWKINGEVVQRSRLRVDTRKWVLSKMLPKIYGDKVAITDPDGGTLKVEFVC